MPSKRLGPSKPATPDTNGIYDNRQGTGWVESWPGGMPHQEIYLALLDQQASAAMAQLQQLLQDSSQRQMTRRIRAQQYRDRNRRSSSTNGDKGCYAFSRNADGTLDHSHRLPRACGLSSSRLVEQLSVLGPLRRSILVHGDEVPASSSPLHALNTDWGLRDVSSDEKIYDGMSYHQGSVWPLFTGWAALAEYRGNQPLAGYQMLMENANLTRAQDLGADTELLSGDFFIPFGRSTSHQLWSSAMVITPTLRGLFGISIDAQTKTITVNPHLPASWDGAAVKHVRLTDGETGIYVFEARAGHVDVALSTP